MGFLKQGKNAGWLTSSNCVQNAFVRLSPSGRNERTPFWSNSTRSVSYHHFDWAFRSSAKSQINEYRQIEFKTPFSTFPIGAKRKNTLGIEIHEVGFIPPFWVRFSKKRKKPNWRISSNWVQKAFFDFLHRGETKKHPWDRVPRGRFHTTILGGFFQAGQKGEFTNIVKLSSKRVFWLSPSGRNEKTPLGSKSTRSISYHNFGWGFPSSAKSRINDYRQIEFKTRFSTFPIGAKRKNTLGIEIHEVGFIPLFWVGFSKQRKKPNWRISSNWVQKAFFDFPHRGETKKHPWDRNPRGRFHTTILGGLFQAAQKAELTNIVKLSSKRVFRLSPSGRNETTPLGSNSTKSVSYDHFEWAFPSRGKRRVDERRPIAFKKRFFDFPHRGETKKHPWDRIPRGRFHTTILSGLFQAGEKGGLTNVVQLRSKSVFSTFPIGAKRKNTLGIEFHEVGFIRPFWVGFSKQGKKPGWRTSSNCVQNAFFRLSTSGRNEKTPLGSNSTRSVSYHHFEFAFPSSAKSRVDERRPIAFRTRFFDFPHRGETKKHPWDWIPRGRFHTTILSGLFQAAQKAGLTNVVQLRSKRVFSTFPIGAIRKNTLGIEFQEVGFIPPFWVGFSKQGKKPGWRTSSYCVQNAFFLTFPIGAKRKNTLGIEFHEVDFISPFRVGFSKRGKKPGWRTSSNCV